MRVRKDPFKRELPRQQGTTITGVDCGIANLWHLPEKCNQGHANLSNSLKIVTKDQSCEFIELLQQTK